MGNLSEQLLSSCKNGCDAKTKQKLCAHLTHNRFAAPTPTPALALLWVGSILSRLLIIHR
jgi:hypothetical protein